MDNNRATAINPRQTQNQRNAATSLAASTPSGRIEQLSMQSTRVFSVNLKLEWRIEKFEMLMRLCKNGQHFVSRKFFSPLAPGIVWELHCYPNGKREEDVGNASFFIRQVGLTHRDEGVRTDFYIYLVGEVGGKVSVCRDIKEFTAQQGRGKFRSFQNPAALIAPAFHADGSLLLVCEAEFIPPVCRLAAEEVKSGMGLFDEDEVEQMETLKLSESLAEMLDNELLSDCHFKIGTKTIAAHRCILAQHSPAFHTMFTAEMSEESKSGVINIVDFESNQVKAMLEFIYTGSINPRMLAKSPESILAIAEKYSIGSLRDYIQCHLASQINKNNFVQIALVADSYFAHSLKKACVRYMAQNHRRIVPTEQWQQLKEERPELTNELLERVLDEKVTGMEVDSPQSDGSGPISEGGQLIFRDVLPFRRGPAILLDRDINPNDEDAEAVQVVLPNGNEQVQNPTPPQTGREPRRVQPIRRVRQVALEEEQPDENNQIQQPAAKRVRRNRN